MFEVRSHTFEKTLLCASYKTQSNFFPQVPQVQTHLKMKVVNSEWRGIARRTHRKRAATGAVPPLFSLCGAHDMSDLQVICKNRRDQVCTIDTYCRVRRPRTSLSNCSEYSPTIPSQGWVDSQDARTHQLTDAQCRLPDLN